MQAGIAPHASVQAGEVEERYFDDQKHREKAKKLVQPMGLQMEFKAYGVGQQVGKNNQEYIDAENEPELGILQKVPEQTSM